MERALTTEPPLMFFFNFLLCHDDKWRKVCVWIRTYSSAELILSLGVIMEQCSLSHLMESLLAGSQRRVHFREFTSQYDMIPKVNSSLHTKLLRRFQCSRWGYSSISLILSWLKFLLISCMNNGILSLLKCSFVFSSSVTNLCGWSMQCHVGNLSCPTHPHNSEDD